MVDRKVLFQTSQENVERITEAEELKELLDSGAPCGRELDAAVGRFSSLFRGLQDNAHGSEMVYRKSVTDAKRDAELETRRVYRERVKRELQAIDRDFRSSVEKAWKHMDYLEEHKGIDTVVAASKRFQEAIARIRVPTEEDRKVAEIIIQDRIRWNDRQRASAVHLLETAKILHRDLIARYHAKCAEQYAQETLEQQESPVDYWAMDEEGEG